MMPDIKNNYTGVSIDGILTNYRIENGGGVYNE